MRLAYKEKSEQSLPYLRKIAALKEENRLLRQKVGWDPPSDSSGDEDEGEGGGEGVGSDGDGVYPLQRAFLALRNHRG